jgi:hypothetical protein
MKHADIKQAVEIENKTSEKDVPIRNGREAVACCRRRKSSLAGFLFCKREKWK